MPHTALMAISGRDYPAHRSLLALRLRPLHLRPRPHMKDPLRPPQGSPQVSQRVAKFPAPSSPGGGARAPLRTGSFAVPCKSSERRWRPQGGRGPLRRRGRGMCSAARQPSSMTRTSAGRPNISCLARPHRLTEEAERLLFQAVPTSPRGPPSMASRTSSGGTSRPEDQVHLRAALAELGLVAFIGDGAIPPRESGESCC